MMQRSASLIVGRQFRGRGNIPFIRSIVAKTSEYYSNTTYTAQIQTRAFATTRRKRPPVSSTRYRTEHEESGGHGMGGLLEPYKHGEADVHEYLKKASLSPFVPVPDPVARKMLQLAEAGEEDIHVELGSGDGRVCFHAIDPPFSVKKSIGVDIDKNLVAMSNDRTQKRHPKPTNIEFHTADLLLDITSSTIWRDTLKEATVITMYFVAEALQKIKPNIERMLAGRTCRIVTCGYAMPGWEPQVVETILGLNVYFYRFGEKIEKYEPRSLTPEERQQAMQEMQELEQPLDEIQPTAFGNEDVEVIDVPLIDETEMIDFHWDDFDEPVDEDPDENYELDRYRKS